MAVKTVVCCDDCDKTLSAGDGFAVKGNIYTVDEDDDREYAGRELVGNNLCTVSSEGETYYEINGVSYLCRKCFVKRLFGIGYTLTAPSSLRDCVTQKGFGGFTNQEIMT